MSDDVKLVLVSGMLGAFLTFVVTRMSNFLDRVKKRNVKNYNSLVMLDHRMNEYGGTVNDNMQSLKNLVEAMAMPMVIPLNRLEKIPLQDGLKTYLQDIDLINRVYSAEYTLRRLNADAETINNHLDSFQAGVINGTLEDKQYKILLDSMRTQMMYLQAYMHDFLEGQSELVAYIHARLNTDKTFSIRLLSWITSLKRRPIYEEELKRIRKKVLEDLETNRKNSLKKKEKIENRVEKQDG